MTDRWGPWPNGPAPAPLLLRRPGRRTTTPGVAAPAGGECIAQSGTFMVGFGQTVVDVDPVRLVNQAEQSVAWSGQVLQPPKPRVIVPLQRVKAKVRGH